MRANAATRNEQVKAKVDSKFHCTLATTHTGDGEG